MFTLPPRETLTVEFKSDRKCLPDDELIQALVCLANSEGGELWLGVEDDGVAPRDILARLVEIFKVCRCCTGCKLIAITA